MTKDALAVLEKMDTGLEFVYERGSGYVGNRHIKKASRILMELFHAMAIRRVEAEGCAAEYYCISPEGRKILTRDPDPLVRRKKRES